MEQLCGKETDRINLLEIHFPARRCHSDIIQWDGNGVPSSGYGLGSVEPICVHLRSLRMQLVVNAAGDPDHFFGRVVDAELEPSVSLPVPWEICKCESGIALGIEVGPHGAIAFYDDVLFDGDVGAALPAIQLHGALKVGQDRKRIAGTMLVDQRNRNRVDLQPHQDDEDKFEEPQRFRRKRFSDGQQETDRDARANQVSEKIAQIRRSAECRLPQLDEHSQEECNGDDHRYLGGRFPFFKRFE